MLFYFSVTTSQLLKCAFDGPIQKIGHLCQSKKRWRSSRENVREIRTTGSGTCRNCLRTHFNTKVITNPNITFTWEFKVGFTRFWWGLRSKFGIHDYQNHKFIPKLGYKFLFTLIICDFPLFSGWRIVEIENYKAANYEGRLYFQKYKKMCRNDISITKPSISNCV